MNAIVRFVGASAIPLGLFNLLGSVVAFIWLAVVGEWALIGWGIASTFLSTYLLGFVLMLSIVFALPGGYLWKRGWTVLASPFIVLGVLYTTAVITLWCGWVLAFAAQRVDNASLVPALLWSFSMATGPLAFMASKEDADNISATMTSYFAQVSYIVMMLAVLLGIRLMEAMYFFSAVMLVGAVLTFILTKQQERERGLVLQRTV